MNGYDIRFRVMAGSGGNTCGLQVFSPILLYHDLSNKAVIRPASRSVLHSDLQTVCFVLAHHAFANKF